MNAFKNKKAKIAISSLTSCEVIWVESKELSNLEKFHNMNVNKMMTMYYHFISQKLLENISNFFRLDFKTKLICYLKDQVEILNTNKIDLSRTEMYSDLGMSRVTLYKLLKNLEEERKLIIRIGYIEIMPSLMTFKKPK
ncbi:cyclic nucleotide-binding domain-containing protein [Aquimarina rhabdastrellae]